MHLSPSESAAATGAVPADSSRSGPVVLLFFGKLSSVRFGQAADLLDTLDHLFNQFSLKIFLVKELWEIHTVVRNDSQAAINTQ